MISAFLTYLTYLTSDQVIRENPANRGTEASAEVSKVQVSKARVYIRYLDTNKMLRAFCSCILSKKASLHLTSRQTFCLQNVWSKRFAFSERNAVENVWSQITRTHGPNVLHKRLAPWRSRGTVLALGLAPRAPACLVGFRRTPQARGRSGVHTGTALKILVGRTTTRTAQCSHLDASPHPHCASV